MSRRWGDPNLEHTRPRAEVYGGSSTVFLYKHPKVEGYIKNCLVCGNEVASYNRVAKERTS